MGVGILKIRQVLDLKLKTIKTPLIKLNIMNVEEKINVLEVCKGNSECIVEDVTMYHLKLLNLDIDDNYKEKLILILEGYETTLKMAMRDVKELKTKSK